jgi:hypothetical protein
MPLLPRWFAEFLIQRIRDIAKGLHDNSGCGYFRAEKEATVIELTEQQRQAVKSGEAIRVTAPEIGEDVVLLRATEYESMRELLQDRLEQRSVLRYSMSRAAKVAQENPY